MNDVARTCSRCGVGFLCSGREYVCDNCHRSRPMRKLLDDPLTFRELQVVQLVRLGKQNKIIAYELCLAEGTVKEYLYRIFRKLDVTNRTELALHRF